MTSDFELLQNLTESDVDIRFNPDVLAVARRLFRAGNVHTPVQEGTLIAAEVRGEDGVYYEPAVAVIAGWVRAMCDCESPDYCPHIGALLLNWVHARDDFASDSDAMAPDFLDYVQELIATLEDEQPIEPADSELVAGAMLRRHGDAQALEAQASQSVEHELRDLLGEQTVQQLRAIARRRGWILRGTRKDVLVNQLVQFYLDAPDTADVVEALDDDRRLAVEYLALRASAIPVPEDLAQSAVRRLKGRRSEEEAVAILQDLQELGLVLAGKGYGETTYCMPAAVVQHVPPWSELLAPLAGDLAKLDVRQSPAFSPRCMAAS